ncbi:heparinase II/III domain-containing protein [Pelagicoccus mobilis]|uniref:Heparinase II/III family protein n=1 Tax=Pelagicoccus mobilis TaxID=415221 RepID=A0A934VQM9_9BACT|nr:heparinase II/III family protein [Pelagicoccus mobilis]MBK1876664.1 heparinase II/III family protein [Pelagicoccus mobilis]
MRAKFASVLVASVGIVGSLLAIDEREFYHTYDGFALPTEVQMPEKEVHPSLWFDASEVKQVLAKKDADATAKEYWQNLNESEFLLADLPPVPKLEDDKKIVHKYYGTLTQVAAYNGLMYQLSDDAKKKAYLAKATEALKRGYAGPLYQLDPIIKGSAVDEIYQGVWAQNFAAAYDWVQPGLSKQDDEIIRGHLIEHARYTYENLWSWAGSPHNHLSKPAWGLGSTALVLSDHPEAKDWLTRAVKAANATTRYFFAGDGMYREGSHYYIFSFINFVPFLYHYENTTGFDAFSYYQSAFEWPIVTRNGKGWMWNFEDSFIRPYPSHLVAKAFLDTPTLLHSKAPLSEVLQWNYQATDYSAFDASEAKSGFNYTGASWDYAKALVEYLCYDPSIAAAKPDVSPVQFMKSGQSVFRSDWDFNDPKSRTLIFHGVAEADNHEHYDHLSFVLHAENQMMSSDAGYTRKSYGEPMRREWYLTDEAHNVVLANGKAPVDVAPNLAPYSSHRFVTPFFSCEIKEAPYAEGGKHRRLVAMLDGDKYAIADFVALPKAGEIEVVMHGGRATLTSSDALHEWRYSNDDYGPAAGLRQWFWGKGFKAKEYEGELTYIKGDYAPFPYLKHSLQGANALGLSLLDPVSDEETGVEYAYERKSESAVVVKSEDGAEWISVNTNGAEIGESVWKTDALFSYFNAGANGIQAAAVDCSKLRIGKDMEFELNGSTTLALRNGENGLELYFTVENPVQGVARYNGRVYRLDLNNSGMLILR